MVKSKFSVELDTDGTLHWDIMIDNNKDLPLLFVIVERILDVLHELGHDDEDVLEIIREAKRN